MKTAVRELNMILTGGVLAVTLLVMAKVGSVVVIVNLVAIGIVGRVVIMRFMVLWLMMVRGGACKTGEGTKQEDGRDENLEAK